MPRRLIVVTNLTIDEAFSSEIIFKVKMTAPLIKLKQAVSEKVSMPRNVLQFKSEGVEISDDDTAEKLQWRDSVTVLVTKKEDKAFKKRETDRYEESLQKLKKTTREKLVNDIELKKTNLENYRQSKQLELDPMENAIEKLQKSLETMKSAFMEVKNRQLKEMRIKEDEIFLAEAELEDFDAFYVERELQAASLKKDFDCPVCYEMMAPPRRIFQCPNGHLLCELCMARSGSWKIKNCPTCRVSLGPGGDVLSRNLAMEKLVETYLGNRR